MWKCSWRKGIDTCHDCYCRWLPAPNQACSQVWVILTPDQASAMSAAHRRLSVKKMLNLSSDLFSGSESLFSAADLDIPGPVSSGRAVHPGPWPNVVSFPAGQKHRETSTLSLYEDYSRITMRFKWRRCVDKYFVCIMFTCDGLMADVIRRWRNIVLRLRRILWESWRESRLWRPWSRLQMSLSVSTHWGFVCFKTLPPPSLS